MAAGSFKSFLDMCLHKEPKERPRAVTLLAHDFIKDTCASLSPLAKRAEVCRRPCASNPDVDATANC